MSICVFIAVFYLVVSSNLCVIFIIIIRIRIIVIVLTVTITQYKRKFLY